MFVRKRDKFGNVSQYKAQLVSKALSKLDYEEAYSPLIDLITFKYFLGIVVDKYMAVWILTYI